MYLLDYNSEIGKVRLNIGDFEDPFSLSDDIIVVKLEEYANEPEELRIWSASLGCLNILLNRAALNASRLREREGGVEVEEYRDQVYKALKERYNNLIASPPAIGDNLPSPLLIGGTSKKETNRIVNDSDNKRPCIGIGWFDSDIF